ncbi:RodZ domain-containing protein [Ferrimonas sp. YFM]|uniref:RodZ domain-containing protein n=1 Tax=Ferrimonas sp. YFM TaxID=3028878 RepID=UPI0025746ADC|nr:RodZ domain-containing protein [Ferrimonas sp. YFM]BDY06350.1 transcriptional regulator [Ferrimonas sp. YFM]
MNDNQQHQEQQEESTVITPGPLLRAAREASGLTTQQVAQRLSLRRSVVEGIENDDYESGTTTTYLRGYVRNYARLVGVSEKQIALALSALPHSQAETNMQSFSRRTSKQQRDSRWMLLTWAIVLALVGLLVWWWVSKPQSLLETSSEISLPSIVSSEPERRSAAELVPQPRPQVPVEQQTVAQTLDASPEVTEADVQGDAQESTIEAQPELTGSEPSQQSDATQAADADEVTAVAEADVAAPVVALDQVSLTLTGDCWMLLKDADGNTLMEGLKRSGYQTALEGKAPLKLRVGAPEVVSLSFNGNPVDMSGYRPGRVAVITLAN